MKYTKLKFHYNKFSSNETDSMNGYIKNRLHTTSSSHHMYVDTDKLEIGQKKFKKKLLEHYNNIITKIEEQI
jgi:hypothetical protein